MLSRIATVATLEVLNTCISRCFNVLEAILVRKSRGYCGEGRSSCLSTSRLPVHAPVCNASPTILPCTNAAPACSSFPIRHQHRHPCTSENRVLVCKAAEKRNMARPTHPELSQLSNSSAADSSWPKTMCDSTVARGQEPDAAARHRAKKRLLFGQQQDRCSIPRLPSFVESCARA